MENHEKEKDPKYEKGSNLTGTARPPMPDEKEFIAHHLNKNTYHPKIQNTGSLLGNIDSHKNKTQHS